MTNRAVAAPETPAVTTDATAVALANTDISPVRRVLGSPATVIAAVIVLFVLFGATQSAMFVDPATWVNILRNTVFLVIVGCFTTLVLISGGLDLSIGSVFMAGAVTSAVAAQAGLPVPVVILAGTSIGVVVGLVNGALIAYAGIASIIVTLGTMFAVRSIFVAMTKGVSIGPLPDAFVVLGQGDLIGIPFLIFYAIAVTVFAHVLLQYANLGWNIRAIGGNRDAASRFGVPVRRISLLVYVMSGASAALAGTLMSARLGAGAPTLGNGFELLVIAAAIIGGTSITGSIGSIPGTVLGSLLLSVLTTGLVLLKLDATLQNFAVGAILIIAAGIDQYRKRRMFRRKLPAAVAPANRPESAA